MTQLGITERDIIKTPFNNSRAYMNNMTGLVSLGCRGQQKSFPQWDGGTMTNTNPLRMFVLRTGFGPRALTITQLRAYCWEMIGTTNVVIARKPPAFDRVRCAMRSCVTLVSTRAHMVSAHATRKKCWRIKSPQAESRSQSHNPRGGLVVASTQFPTSTGLNTWETLDVSLISPVKRWRKWRPSHG